MKKFISYIKEVFSRRRSAKQKALLLDALRILKEQKPRYEPNQCYLPSVSKEYRAACRCFLDTTETVLRFNVNEWTDKGNPHTTPVAVQEQSEEEAVALFNYAAIDHRAIALSLAQ